MGSNPLGHIYFYIDIRENISLYGDIKIVFSRNYDIKSSGNSWLVDGLEIVIVQ